jgi:hypothetical protein
MRAHKVKIDKATDALLVRLWVRWGVERTYGLMEFI